MRTMQILIAAPWTLDEAVEAIGRALGRSFERSTTGNGRFPRYLHCSAEIQVSLVDNTLEDDSVLNYSHYSLLLDILGPGGENAAAARGVFDALKPFGFPMALTDDFDGLVVKYEPR